jgi:hypothetical protein
MQISVNKDMGGPKGRVRLIFLSLLTIDPSIVQPKSGEIRQDDNQLQLLKPADGRSGVGDQSGGKYLKGS